MLSSVFDRRLSKWLGEALLPTLLLSMNGCATTWGDAPMIHPAESRLSEIETTQLEQKSATAPVNVEEASTRPMATQPSTAAEIELSLEAVRAAALENNLDLRVELVNPSIAQQEVNIEAAKFEATFFAAGAYVQRDDPIRLENGQNYTAGLRAPLITGGTARIAVPFDVSDASPTYQAGARFSISQPLLRDAGVQTNLVSIRIAQYQQKIVDAQTKLQAIRILANADRAYWLLYNARGILEVNREQYELADRQLDQARKRVAAEASPRIEITRAESGAASRLQGIIVAQTAVRRAERDLRRIMNRPDLPMESETAIVPTTKPNPLGLKLSAQDLSVHAIDNRLEMLQLELRLSQDASLIDFARNQTLPLFVLDFDYNLLHPSDRLDGAFELGNGGNTTDWTVAVRAEVPLGNQAARSALRRAILERVQRLGTRDRQQQAIVQEVHDSVDQFNETWQRIIAARSESILSGRTYEAELRQFELGVRTSTDVLDAARRLADAQLREIDALVDYEIARINIAFATGTLLGHGRVVMPPPQPDAR